MPTYEYACTSCGTRVEVVQGFNDAPLEVCGECSGTLKRVFHPVGIVLKGSGFYSTDNRSGKSLTPGKDGTGEKTDTKKDSSKGAAPKKKDTSSGSSGSGSSGSGSSGSGSSGSSGSGSSGSSGSGTAAS